MPLEFISMVKGFHEPSFDDRGFLMHLTRAQWNNSATSEAMNLLRSYAEPYYEMKCPESKDDPPEEDGSDSESQSKDDASSSSNNKTKKKSYCIKFAVRNLHNNSHCFVACNLADPEDFTNFLFSKLAEDTHDLPKTDMQIRIFPVQRISEAKPRIVEETFGRFLSRH
ncbi:hypothetical protein EGW08_016184 [Elysia chlorotica]|uniref:Uncharacterized protein n=1 Tax=Elysia chlorotica TaxID=188477 RepID=A0A433T3D6_ELYCH|nr:hypothetical protein EGW08_016184 [Elysia chlorotica]